MFKFYTVLLALYIATFSGTSSTASASLIAPGDGKDAALRVCEGLSMSSYKRECITLVGESRYFDSDALPLCSGFSMNSRVMDCMRVIRDRRYSAQEVRTCSGESFDSDKVDCMGRLGEDYTPPSGSLRNDLERVLRMMDSGDLNSARRSLVRIIDTLEP